MVYNPAKKGEPVSPFTARYKVSRSNRGGKWPTVPSCSPVHQNLWKYNGVWSTNFVKHTLINQPVNQAALIMTCLTKHLPLATIVNTLSSKMVNLLPFNQFQSITCKLLWWEARSLTTVPARHNPSAVFKVSIYKYLFPYILYKSYFLFVVC